MDNIVAEPIENSMEVEYEELYNGRSNEENSIVIPLALVAVNVAEPQNEIVLGIDEEEGHISPTNSLITSETGNSPSVSTDEDSNPSDPRTDLIQGSPKKRCREDDSNDDDGSLCPICLDNWTNTGDHRICALRCGHLFGYKCVNRWLNSQTKKTCPTCKERVIKGDIRYIYAKRLTAVDTSELENVKKQLIFVSEERKRALADLTTYAFKEQQLHQEIAHLKRQLNIVNSKAVTLPNTTNFRPEMVRVYMDKSLEICKGQGCRVFDANCSLDLLLASVKSPTNLFMGYGLKKLNISSYRSLAFIPTHTLQIRDICFHPQNNWVLTASMDKTFKVVNNCTNTVTHQFAHQMPLWSCCWDVNDHNLLYIGTQSGVVLQYDLRNLSNSVTTLSVEGDMSPVVSVASIPPTPGDILPQGGIVSCKLSSLWLFENYSMNRHPLNLDGPFVSMKYQASTQQLLVSSRPNSRITYSRHTLCTLDKKNENSVDCNIIHSFQGGGMQKLLSKSCFLRHSSDFVAAYQENCHSVVLWSIHNGEKVCSIPARETVLDLKGLQNNNGDFLVSLTERKLEFFKFFH